MFFKNKTTGLVHGVVHPDHIKRCQNDSNYEEVKVKKQSNNKKHENNAKTKKQTNKISANKNKE